MNKVSQFLIEEAKGLRESSPELVAVELLKQAGIKEGDAKLAVAQDTFEKKACYELTYAGVDSEEAAKLVKAANINVKDLPNVTFESEEERLASILEKAASFIEKQASYIEDLEKSAGQVRTVEVQVEAPKEPELPKVITKMASVNALTFEDVEALRGLSQETLEKVANAMEEPWSMGKGIGIENPKTDPMLDFLLGK